LEEEEARGGGREWREGEATSGGTECILVSTLPATGSWRREKQQVEVESVFS
jgi:glutamate/tyrosine decarboxylase-like PLP-dependent enzyme